MFSKVGGHMPALELKLEDEDKPYYKNMELWEKYDPINIARNNNIYSDIDVYLDAGDKDEGRFYEGCSILHKILKQKGINSQNHIFTGNHSAEYIQSNIAKYIKFYGC
jgi:enterochelin esterase-like enzyme